MSESKDLMGWLRDHPIWHRAHNAADRIEALEGALKTARTALWVAQNDYAHADPHSTFVPALEAIKAVLGCQAESTAAGTASDAGKPATSLDALKEGRSFADLVVGYNFGLNEAADLCESKFVGTPNHIVARGFAEEIRTLRISALSQGEVAQGASDDSHPEQPKPDTNNALSHPTKPEDA